MRWKLPLSCLLVLALPGLALGQPPSYLETEAGQVRPLAMSADGNTLYAVNTPDARLEIFDLTGALPVHTQSVPVGLQPVAVAVESASRVWVVNHLSDSVSVVDVSASPARVVRTLLVGDEPRDIVFAGPSRSRAFITTAHRGQNAPSPRGEYATEGVGRADVWVFNAAALGDGLGGDPVTIVRLFGDVPRALAVSPDGTRVYAAVFLSGNRTTALPEGVVCDGGPTVGPCTTEGTTYPGGLPAPVTNHAGVRGPEVGLIVQFRDGAWRDELDRDWSAGVRFDLPDEDVFEIDAMAATPTSTRQFSGVGTVLYGMAVHPTSGALYVANTEANNAVRFEGPGTYVRETGARPGLPATVRGHLHQARITVIDDGTVTPHPLNPHIDYDAEDVPDDIRWRTISTPTSVAFAADGTRVYVTALGSSAIGVLDTSELESGAVDTSLSRMIHLRDDGPSGPTGLVLDEARGRLYTLTRFDDAVVTVDLDTEAVLDRTRMHTPEPELIVTGRPVMYDALATASNGESSCGSCHVFGDLDGLAWDLGDPDGDVLSNPNPRGVIGGGTPFSPLKGPMTTQSFRGLADHGPMHWRGDRTAARSGGDPLDERGAFEAFNVAFEGLLGREEGALSTADMRRFAEFATHLVYPPNPIRQLDNSLRADEARGRDIYFNRAGVDSIATCNGCHVLDRAEGFFGGDGRTTFEGETQDMKVPHLRNLYQKVGMFGMASVPFFDGSTDFSSRGPQVRGFGFLHDGSTDTVDRFFHATVFTGLGVGTDTADLEAFMMAYDSNLPPVVGQQITIGEDASAEALARATLLSERALTSLVWGASTTTECELVVRGVFLGEMRGWLLEGDGMLHSDRAAEAPVSIETALGFVSSGNGPFTLTCVPPGSGARLAYDRDEDGSRDGDEIDDGTDPASRPFFTLPDIMVPPPSMPSTDGGPPDLDAGTDAGSTDADGGPTGSDAGTPSDGGLGTDAGPGDPEDHGCGCTTVGRRQNSPWPLGFGLLGLLAWRRSRRRVAAPR
ncbi:MAG: YncE family protein [Sandaracinaceae bacterium]